MIYKGLILLLFLIAGCTAPVKPVKKAAATPSFKTISFSEALDSTYNHKLELTFQIPDMYEVKTSDYAEGSVFWGEKAEVERASAFSGAIERGKSGFFRIFVPDDTKYDPGADKFTDEQQLPQTLKVMGAKNIVVKRRNLGGHPGLVVSAITNGKKIYSCFLATYVKQEVLAFQYFVPLVDKGNEDSIWEKFLSGIKRVKVAIKEIKGENAESLLKSTLEKMNYNRYRLRLYSRLRPDLDVSPFVSQEVLVDHSSGFNTSLLQLHGSGVMVLNGKTLNFGNPWNLPKVEVTLKNNGGKVTFKMTVNGKSQAPQAHDFSEFAKKEVSPLKSLLSQPVYVCRGLDSFYSDLFSMFNIKIVGEKGDNILLKGTPNLETVERFIKQGGMDSTVRGVSVAEELIKTFTLIEFSISKKTGLPGKITVSGRQNKYSLKTEIEFFKF